MQFLKVLFGIHSKEQQPTLESILASFTEAQAALGNLVREQGYSRDVILEQVLELEDQAEHLLHQKRKALVVLENLNNLLGND